MSSWATGSLSINVLERSIVVLSALASLWPAVRAARINVREALAHE